MLIAFFTTITVLPAALQLSKPPAEPRPMGFERLAPIDRFTMAHRISILVVTLAIVLAASPLLLRVHFDFNPLHLQNSNVEAVATFSICKAIPTRAQTRSMYWPRHCPRQKHRSTTRSPPQVSQIRTIGTFIPDAQDRKLAEIANAMAVLSPVLGPAQPGPAPTDAEIVEALNSAADALLQASGGRSIWGQLRRPSSPLYSNSLPQPTHGCARRPAAHSQPPCVTTWIRSASCSTHNASPCQLFRPRSPATGSPQMERPEFKCFPKAIPTMIPCCAISRPRCLRSNRPRPELPSCSRRQLA